MTIQQISNTFIVEIDGKAIPPEVAVDSISVDDNLHLPDAFAITIRDGARTAIDLTKVKVGSKVKIAVLSDDAPSPQPLIAGDVTSLEAEIFAGVGFTIVRGYDESHRLFRGRSTVSYQDSTYADIAERIAKRNQLAVGTIHSTSPVHEYVAQNNLSDWDFLWTLANEVNHEVAVSDGKLHFRKRQTAVGAPREGDLNTESPLTLTNGGNLLYLRASLTAAEQVKEVEVRSWDRLAKQVLKAKESVKTDAFENGISSQRFAEAFPAPPLVSNDVPLATAAEVENAAHTLADAVAGCAAHLEGRARGNTKLRAGSAVSLSLIGAPFDGKYLVTTTSHTFDQHDGYVTSFTITGRHERSLLGLMSGSARSNRIAGVAVGVVDDVSDPEKLGRVRVKFPWMADEFVSPWCRTVHAGAGKQRGWYLVPEVGDEVLVGFDQGDIRHPFVIGGLYNQHDAPEPGLGAFFDSSTHEVNNRIFTSRLGHKLIFCDDQQSPSLTLVTSDGGAEIKLDQKGKKIQVKSSGDVMITADGDVTVEAKGTLTLKGAKVNIEASGALSAKGASATLEGSGSVAVKGQPIQLN